MKLVDFGDGNGPVPSHAHCHGGGWVADTATVEPTAYVGPDARVGGFAHVLGKAEVTGHGQVLDHAVATATAMVNNYAILGGFGVLHDAARICGHCVVMGRVGGHVVVDEDRIVGSAETLDDTVTVEEAQRTTEEVRA